MTTLLCGMSYLVLVFGVIPLLIKRRTGESGWLATLGSTGSERLANVLFVLAWLLALASPALTAAAVLRPIDLPGGSAGQAAAGIGLYAAGSVLGVTAQLVMGAAWRTGVVPDRPSELVSRGPFRLIRNPVYTSMVTCQLALAVLVPTWVAVVALVACVTSLQLHTRLVEEPHLLQVHGPAYRRYAARTGRYVPLLGRWHAESR